MASLVVHLQPILSPAGNRLFGYEALLRGLNARGEIIPPLKLFAAMQKSEQRLALDREARVMAIKAFEPYWRNNAKLVLFVNFESSLVDTFSPQDHALFDGLLTHYGIPFSNIVLEVKEDEVVSNESLQIFCKYYRGLGFNIALDDFGVGQSSFDRIAIVKPDIIKIDRSLMTDIQQNQIHQEVVTAICNMCQNIGAMALAEGVETLDESIYALMSGALLMQGFYFAKPQASPCHRQVVEKLLTLQTAYTLRVQQQQEEAINLFALAEQIKQYFMLAVAQLSSVQLWNSIATVLLNQFKAVEAIYVIDAHSSRQIGDTIVRYQVRPLYQPTEAGYDYSLKEGGGHGLIQCLQR
ncbi:MAG: EAL domain-containing protein [Gammaproteobacteria bacterium]|nr:EAL domain-containing protein [Gammaproteobacteria bacterium]